MRVPRPLNGRMTARFVTGLTGNIASGKSLVSRLLADRGADVIDADRVAHETYLPGTPVATAIVERFGAAVLHPDGSVNRAALGAIVFTDPEALADLEALVHPAVRALVFDRLERSTADVAVLEAIKLLEGPLVDRTDAVWVVTAPREVRIERLVRDRGLSLEEAARRVDAQSPEAEKVRRADVVIVNDGSLADLQRQVEAAWESLPVWDRS